MNKIDHPATLPAARCGRILVADDEDKNRKLLRDILIAQGHEVLLAEDGQAALDAAFAELPDVILLDVMMPKMNGFDVCRTLKADPRSAPIPILMITVLSAREDRIRGVDAGADDYLSKPIDREELVLRVRNALVRKHLYDDLQNKILELQAMAELRESLTSLINADTDALSLVMRKRGGAGGSPKEGEGHGAH
jgi:DNA-binding response OmpR family regulator